MGTYLGYKNQFVVEERGARERGQMYSCEREEPDVIRFQIDALGRERGARHDQIPEAIGRESGARSNPDSRRTWESEDPDAMTHLGKRGS